MSKNKAVTLVMMIMLGMTYGAANAVPTGPFGYDLQKDMHRDTQKKEEPKKEEDQNNIQTTAVPTRPTSAKQFYSFIPIKDLYNTNIDTNVYYQNASINSAIAKYKKGNYTGSLQELYSFIKKHPNDAYAYYYMGMAYTKLGQNQLAAKCYQKSINCDAKGQLLEQALKGRDCILGGAYCHAFDAYPTGDGVNSLDAFINAPYTGNGFSPELEKQFQQDKLRSIQKQMNRKDELDEKDIENIQEFQNKSEGFIGEKLAMAASVSSEPSDAEVLEAIDVLKRAGLNISTGTSNTSSNTANTINPSDLMPSQEMQQLNMLLGGNSNNNDSMMNMVPFLMNANNNGQKVDPQVIQSMMMNSMMNSLNNMDTNDNK